MTRDSFKPEDLSPTQAEEVEYRAWELLEAECGKPLPFDVPTSAALSAVRAALTAAQQQDGGEVRAWETEDGRVISARQKETALRDGGASASSVAIYSIPLYAAPQSTPADAEVWLFKGTDGEWRTFHNEQHRLDTIADGRWEVRKFAALPQQPAMDGCHCGTCTCNPNMTPAVRYDLSPAQKEGAIREHLIRLGWTPPVGAAEDMVLDAIERRESSAPAAVDEAVVKRAVAAVMSAPAGISVEAYVRIVLEAALAQQPAPVGVKPLSEFMAEQEALHPGIHDKVQAAADELRASLAQQPVQKGGGDGWKPSSVEPPHNPKEGSLGTEYLIYPPTSGGDRTAFYGRRLGGAACWYRYGAQVHGVEYWHELPAIPATLTGERDG